MYFRLGFSFKVTFDLGFKFYNKKLFRAVCIILKHKRNATFTPFLDALKSK